MYLLPRKDVPQGLKWMRLSAEQGNQDAQLLLGQTYMQGVKELPRDLVLADMWMRLAARNNLPFYELQVDGLERQMNSADIAKAKALAAAWAKDNIQVNAVLPGWIDTDHTRRAREQLQGLNERVLSRTPAGRWGEPADLAGIAVFLAAKASDFVTGTAIPVDGGYSSLG